MKVKLTVHVIHVAGKRMNELVIYGLSGGDFLEGVVAVKDPLEMLPLDVGSLGRAGRLKQWILNWW